MRTLIRTVFVVCAFAGIPALAACGGGGNGGAPSATPSTMSDAQILSIGKEVAECIRNNGVPDFPDPFVERGRLKLPEEAEQSLEGRYSQQVMDQAQQSCKSIFDRLPESAIRGDDGGGGDGGDPNRQEPGPGDVEALKKFSQCIRDNGIPEWPDPKADGSFPLRGTPLENEGKSDRMRAAVEPCQQYWGGGFKIS